MRLFSFSAKTGAAALSIMAAATVQSLPAHATEYSCDAGSYSFSTAKVSSKKIRLTDAAGNTATLRRQNSASGETFAGKDSNGARYELSVKGSDAMLMVDGKYAHKDCVAKVAEVTAPRAQDYACEGGAFTFSLLQTGPESYNLIDGAGNKVHLGQSAAGSGVKLSGKDADGDAWEVSLKGDEGMVKVGDALHKDCRRKN